MKPKTLPILKAEMLCRQQMSNGHRRCLLGWACKLFPDCADDAQRAMELIADENIVRFNDDPRNPLAKVADVWNEAMAKLGYLKRGNKLVLTGKAACPRERTRRFLNSRA